MKYTFLDFVKAQWTTIPPVQKQDLSGKTIIVTGGNTGIGFEVVKHFARMNPAKLILTSRSQEKGNEAVVRESLHLSYLLFVPYMTCIMSPL